MFQVWVQKGSGGAGRSAQTAPVATRDPAMQEGCFVPLKANIFLSTHQRARRVLKQSSFPELKSEQEPIRTSRPAR